MCTFAAQCAQLFSPGSRRNENAFKMVFIKGNDSNQDTRWKTFLQTMEIVYIFSQ